MPSKTKKFEELDNFPNCFFLSFPNRETGLGLKGKWKKDFFKNENPIVLELGCGKGEYTVGLAKNNAAKNFIGVDAKGARIWVGAKEAIEQKMNNVAFIITRIEFIEGCFAKNEIDEIWLTFPDPQPQKTRARKRLTHSLFLNRYMKFLKPNGHLHLKTDSTSFYDYTLGSLNDFGMQTIIHTNDLYNNVPKGREELTSIITYYEKMFTERGEKIKYCLCKKLIND